MNRLCAWAAGLPLIFAHQALPAQSTVTLISPASPGTAGPGTTTVTLTGTGFPAGSIPAANITVTMQSQHAGQGPTVTTQAQSVEPLFGTTDLIAFTVPATLDLKKTIVYEVSIAGTTASGAAFSSGNTASLNINPPASLASVDGWYVGSYGSPGQSLLMNIDGNYTSFAEGSTFANFGPGVSVGGAAPGAWGPLAVGTTTSATASIVISTTAVPGVNSLSVATGNQQVDWGQGFVIQNWSPVYGFRGGTHDGANPKRVPIIGTVPNWLASVFGVTPYGGTSNFGTVYSYPLAFGSGDEVLYSFAGPPNDGMTPDGALVLGNNNVLYGTTGGGGTSSNGTIFSLTPPATPGDQWTEAVLHNFSGGPTDGSYSYAAMVVAGESNGLPILYGTTFYGGTNANGVVFSLSPPSTPGGQWIESILHYFTGAPNDGANPHTAVTPGPAGVYYGTTYNGGSSNLGTVFQLTPPAAPGGEWTESILYSFAGSPSDGANPHGDLVLGPGGILYGTTLGGGPLGRGTVFSLTPPKSPKGKWTETLLYEFGSGTDATQPRAGLVLSTNASGRLVLYGTTYMGGTSGDGTVFSLTAPATPGGAWTETILFDGYTGVSNPEAGLVMDSQGGLWGASYNGGSAGFGTVYYVYP